jgi:hypothetical protein
MGRSARNGLAFLAAGLLALVFGVSAGAAAGEAGPWLGLAGGHVGSYRWMVEAKRPDGPAGAGQQGARRPCLLVGTKWRTGRFSYRRSQSRQCAGADGLLASEPPLVAKGVQPSSGGPARLTAVGMIFAPTARRLRVTLAGGDTRTIPLAVLSPDQADAAGLAPFRYAAFATHGEWCAERLITESASGHVLWDSGVDGYRCGETSGPPRFAG